MRRPDGSGSVAPKQPSGEMTKAPRERGLVGFLPTGKKGERMDDTTAVLVTIDEDTARLIRQMAYVALRTRVDHIEREAARYQTSEAARIFEDCQEIQGWLSALVDLNRDPE